MLTRDVEQAVHENRKEIAVKVFNVLPFEDSVFRKEFDNLKMLKHQNIVELVGFYNDIEEVLAEYNGKQVTVENLHMALCLEYVQNGHLGKYISGNIVRALCHTYILVSTKKMSIHIRLFF